MDHSSKRMKGTMKLYIACMGVYRSLDEASRKERERGRTTLSIRPRGIADCDNVAENKLGHTTAEEASKQCRFQNQHCKSECEKNLLRVRIANAAAAATVLHG